MTGWSCQEYKRPSRLMRADELRAGRAEFEMPLGHATCQAVGYMCRKLRGEAVKTMPPLGAGNQRQNSGDTSIRGLRRGRKVHRSPRRRKKRRKRKTSWFSQNLWYCHRAQLSRFCSPTLILGYLFIQLTIISKSKPILGHLKRCLDGILIKFNIHF